MTESIIPLLLFPFIIPSTFSNCSLSTQLRFVYTTKSMLMTLAVRLILMEIPTAYKVLYIIENPLSQLPWARVPFYRVPVLGLKERLVERYPGLIILMGPDFSEEYFSLMRGSCLRHRVSRWAVLTPSLQLPQYTVIPFHI